MELEVKCFKGGDSSLKATEWIPYLILAEDEFSYNVIKEEDNKPSFIWDTINWENTYFLEVRHDSGEIMGRCIVAYPLSKPTEFNLFALYVTPMFREQKVASTLLNYAENLGNLTLSTRTENEVMNNILLKRGYTETTRKISQYSNKEEITYMRRINES